MEKSKGLNERRKPKRFVLVHGAGHGAWCWYKVRCVLEKAGHKVTCLDLVGAGVDATDPSSVRTFEQYSKPLTDLLAGLPEDGDKVVLVGHSAGGLSVTYAIHEFGPKIDAAVYVTANMLRNGFCTEEDAKAVSPQLFKREDINKMKTPRGIMKEEYQRKFLYNMSPEEDQIMASMLLRPTPGIVVFQEARFYNDEVANKVRRIYVKAMQDQIVTPAQQDTMIHLWPPAQVHSLDSDHSPFFSTPTELCNVLLNV